MLNNILKSKKGKLWFPWLIDLYWKIRSFDLQYFNIREESDLRDSSFGRMICYWDSNLRTNSIFGADLRDLSYLGNSVRSISRSFFLGMKKDIKWKKMHRKFDFMIVELRTRIPGWTKSFCNKLFLLSFKALKSESCGLWLIM